MTQVELKVIEYARSVDWDFAEVQKIVVESYNKCASAMSESIKKGIENQILNNMKTKVTVLGEEPKEKELKPIELLYHTTGDQPIKAHSSASNPKYWENIVLIAKDYENGFDLILVYDIEKKHRCRSLMLGYWNDGIVE